MVSRETEASAQQCFQEVYLLGFFFAMRSCEHVLVTGTRKTQPIRLRDLQFIHNNRVLRRNSKHLEQADTISITFEYQKRDLRNDKITQSKSGHSWMCPVKAAAAIVRRMKRLKLDDDAFIYTYRQHGGQLGHLTSTMAIQFLRDFIKSVDYEARGLDPERIGNHSNRSSAAMAMYLNKVPVCTIMLLGRWSSDAFLRYIRPQVAQLTNGVAKQMIENPSFYTVPNASSEDPRTHNPKSAAANFGMGSGSAINQEAFSVWE